MSQAQNDQRTQISFLRDQVEALQQQLANGFPDEFEKYKLYKAENEELRRQNNSLKCKLGAEKEKC